MDRLEGQALEKTREKDKWKVATLELFKEGRLGEKQLEMVIDKAFILGHNAGHCRGENFKNRHLKEIKTS